MAARPARDTVTKPRLFTLAIPVSLVVQVASPETSRCEVPEALVVNAEHWYPPGFRGTREREPGAVGRGTWASARAAERAGERESSER